MYSAGSLYIHSSLYKQFTSYVYFIWTVNSYKYLTFISSVNHTDCERWEYGLCNFNSFMID